MKIGITGDTHGSMQAMRKLLSVTPPVDLWLHTGDHAEDALFCIISQVLIRLRYVAIVIS